MLVSVFAEKLDNETILRIIKSCDNSTDIRRVLYIGSYITNQWSSDIDYQALQLRKIIYRAIDKEKNQIKSLVLKEIEKKMRDDIKYILSLDRDLFEIYESIKEISRTSGDL